MKTHPLLKLCRRFVPAFPGLALLLWTGGAAGQQLINETQMDIPASFHKYFGQRVNSWKDTERQIAKLDLDGDLNQDGILSNTDPADGGAFESTPPGLLLGLGEMSRVVLRLTPYRVDFDGEVVVTLEVAGINRGHPTGEYGSFEEELASMGHIRVWRDKDKKTLVLDSRDPARRFAEFTTQYRTYPFNLPIAVPRFFFVEATGVSPKYSGDIRLLATVAHRAVGSKRPMEYYEVGNPGGNPPPAGGPVNTGGYDPNNPGAPISGTSSPRIRSFRTSFDHLLLTVQPEPRVKEFINNNNEGNWVPPPGKSYD
jgi:hypothetical protein